MTANHDRILSEFMAKCDELFQFVRHSASEITAYEAEARVFEIVLELGALGMTAYLDAQAPLHHGVTATDKDGHVLKYSGERQGLLYSIFGEISYKRSYFCGDGRGWFPMDGALNLPPKGHSDFLRKFMEEFAIDMSYDDTTTKFAKYFPVATSTRGIKDAIAQDSQDVEAFYAQATPPQSPPEATILAVQADGKGVAMRKAAVLDTLPGQEKEGPKRDGKKKEVTVVSVSTHVPYFRTAEQVRESLFREKADDGVEPGDGREKPAVKLTWTDIEGKRAAISQAQVWAAVIGYEYVKYRIALTDGQPSLQDRVDESFPDYVRILDLIHATSYLWSAADAYFGKGTDKARKWVYDNVLLMLQGKTRMIIDEIDKWLLGVADKERAKWVKLEKSANYFEKNLDAMKYDEYIANGWPIATGIIEGACRHVVKDRCERSGMTWTQNGVQALLQLRCIHQNGDWDAYHAFRMRNRHENVWGVKNFQTNGPSETDVHQFNSKSRYAAAA